MARQAKPMTDLTGTGGPDYFRALNTIGWQKDWKSSTPLYGNQPHLVHIQSVNPVLLHGLKQGASRQEVEAAAKAFGEVVEVHLPEGVSFAFARFKSDEDAVKCSAGLREVGGAPASAQPAKHSHADVIAWRASMAARYAAV